MKKAYSKDIWRAICKGKKRFLAIMMITTLGVAMFSALEAACVDLRYSADDFLDMQNLYDISVVSTLGLTEDDVSALSELEEVELAEGAYSETVHMEIGEKNCNVALKTLSQSGMNQPYVLEGELPQNVNEMAITIRFQQDTGKSIGDTVEIEEDLEEDEEATFLHTEYEITAVVIDPMDLNNSGGAVSFRSSSTEDYTLFVRPEAVDSEVYTAVHMTLVGGREMFCYGEEYENYVAEVVDMIETDIKEQREQARYDDITGEALAELAEAESEAEEEFAEAERELQEAAEKIADGRRELADGEKELAEKQQDAIDGFAKAREELETGKIQLELGRQQLHDAANQLAVGEAQLAEAKQTLTDSETAVYAQISEARTQLTEQLTMVQASRAELEAQVQAIAGMYGEMWPADEWNAYVQAATLAYIPVIEAQMSQADTSAAEAAVEGIVQEAQNSFLMAFAGVLDMAKAGIDAQIAMLDVNAVDYEMQLTVLNEQKAQLESMPGQMAQLAMGMGQVLATEQVLSAQIVLLDAQETTAREEFAAAWQEIASAEAELEGGKRQIEHATAEIVQNESLLAEGEEELLKQEEDVNRQIADGWKEIEDGKQELADGEAELDDGLKEFEEKKAEVAQEIDDARKKIEDIDMTQWYVQDRTSLSGYSNIESDAAAIEAIGTVFPLVFFIVAILISLTTITRMVEEDRGLIGTYKALGFTDKEIRRKYLIYAFAASLMGSILGNIFGFIVLPGIIFVIFQEMYLLPDFVFRFDYVYGICGPVIFMAGIVGATAAACKTELLQMPAVLMRPKTPRSGSRVFLEYITPIWNRMSFLNKVTARNLFRYKKRLFMTVAGIMGCMALLLFGFAVKDSVTDLMPRQYEQVYCYDLMAVAMAEDNEELLSYVEKEEEVDSYLNIQIESVKLKNGKGNEEKVQLFVVPEGVEFSEYIQLRGLDGEAVTVEDGGIYVTQNASEVLTFAAGDTVSVQRLDLSQRDVKVLSIVKNYLGNNIYMTQATYEELFEEYEPNGVLLNLSEACTDHRAYAEELGEKDGVLTSMSTAELKEDFSQAFTLINMVVYVVIVMAACLAFVVLFTLSTTNISERQRELATIKVLGFYDHEVHLYVNKETMILTGIGILCGVPLGYAFAQTLTYILKIPSMYLAVSLHTESYLIAGGMSFVFAMIVNMITDRSLDSINPVEALKSIE